eukprot:scaffold4639_cov22-Tisochrysis_lutea.AAC.4
MHSRVSTPQLPCFIPAINIRPFQLRSIASTLRTAYCQAGAQDFSGKETLLAQLTPFIKKSSGFHLQSERMALCRQRAAAMTKTMHSWEVIQAVAVALAAAAAAVAAAIVVAVAQMGDKLGQPSGAMGSTAVQKM